VQRISVDARRPELLALPGTVVDASPRTGVLAVDVALPGCTPASSTVDASFCGGFGAAVSGGSLGTDSRRVPQATSVNAARTADHHMW
jgi:hypothetical protein